MIKCLALHKKQGQAHDRQTEIYYLEKSPKPVTDENQNQCNQKTQESVLVLLGDIISYGAANKM
jgi:hypothetical protein